MTTEQQDVVFQHWRRVIQSETWDLASLEQVCEHALADPVVRNYLLLQSMIQAELQKRRAELDPKLQNHETSTAPPASRPTWRPELSEPIPATTPEQDREQQRASASEIKVLAAAVRNFHRVAGTVSETTEEFRETEASFLLTIQKFRSYDAEWFSEIVPEVADFPAEWTVPPTGANGRTDRFLDSIDAGLNSIRTEMRETGNEQDSQQAES